MLYRVHLAWTGFEIATLVVISTDCIGSYKSNYHTITTVTAPVQMYMTVIMLCLNTKTLLSNSISHVHLHSNSLILLYISKYVPSIHVVKNWLLNMHPKYSNQNYIITCAVTPTPPFFFKPKSKYDRCVLFLLCVNVMCLSYRSIYITTICVLQIIFRVHDIMFTLIKNIASSCLTFLPPVASLPWFNK